MNFTARLTLGKNFKTVETKNGKSVFQGSAWEGFKPDKTKDEWAYRWYDIKMFGQNAEMAKESFEKGTKFNCEGWVVSEEWNDKDTGAKRSKFVFNIKDIDVISGQAKPSAVTTEDIPW